MKKYFIKDKKKCMALVMATVFTFLAGCSKENVNPLDGYKYEQEINVIDDNNRTYYEVFVYSYYDSDGDGIGDINGVTQKLDYIQELGFNGIWLMPIMPSPTYHKYDTTDYCDVDSEYGIIDDFKNFLEECHKRDIHVIIDFMMNHTSSKHKWFEEACTYLKGLGKEEVSVEKCPYVDYYHFEKKEDAGTNYYQIGNSEWYYEGSFWDQMPDLDLYSEAVRGELERAAKFWLDLGVDGFRIDGVKYFDTSDERNIEILGWFNDYVKNIKEDAYIVSEVWSDYPIASEYLKSGVNSTFDFTMGQASGIICSSINQSDEKKVGKNLAEAVIGIQEMTKTVNPNATVAEFLTNHDTGRCANFLVTPERIKMAYALEILMTGNVFVYYGEEIGLSGSGKDENLRAPMYWSNTDNTGMTNGPADMDKEEYMFPSLAEQQDDATSIYNFIKRCIRIRNENPEIARGEVAIIEEVEDESICALTKTYEDSKLVLLYNVSKESKTVTISKDTYGYEQIRGYVSTDGTEVTLKGDTVTLPPYSAVVLK